MSGLRFPASDIPAQARELYRHSPMRWVADRDAAPTPLDIDPDWGSAQAAAQMSGVPPPVWIPE